MTSATIYVNRPHAAGNKEYEEEDLDVEVSVTGKVTRVEVNPDLTRWGCEYITAKILDPVGGPYEIELDDDEFEYAEKNIG